MAKVNTMFRFRFRETKTAFIVFFGFLLLLILFSVPLNQVLPEGFSSFIPEFLTNISILDYIQQHANLVYNSLGYIFLVAILLFFLNWRGKKRR